MKTSRIIHKILIITCLPVVIVLASCGSGNTGIADSPEYRELVEQVNDLDFEIENEWANPVRGGRINLQGNNNFIRFDGDQVEVHLPFFGVRHSGGGYGSEGAIKYEGPLEDLRIEENRRKGEIKLYFTADQRTENLNFILTFYPNGRTNTSVTSSQRDSMGYDGRIVE